MGGCKKIRRRLLDGGPQHSLFLYIEAIFDRDTVPNAMCPQKCATFFSQIWQEWDGGLRAVHFFCHSDCNDEWFVLGFLGSCSCSWVTMHPPGLDAEALGRRSKKGEKSTTNECASYCPPSPSSELIHFREGDGMIHTLLLEMIAWTDLIPSVKADLFNVTASVQMVAFNWEQCNEF